jgi:hypothetical protein
MSVVRKRSTERTGRRVAYLAVAATLLAAPGLAIAGGGFSSPPAFSLKTTVTITGVPLNSFDISFVNPELHAYTLSDRSNQAIDVIDTSSKTQSKLAAGQFAGVVTTLSGVTCPPNSCDGPNGNLSFNNNGVEQVWAGDGPRTGCTARQPLASATTTCSTVKVIDFATGAVLHNIPTGGQYRADELCYDPADHLIQIANDSDSPPYINYIPTEGPNAYKVVKQINFDGLPGDGPNATNGIEQCQWNARNGMIYLNVPEVNGNGNDIADGRTLVIDPRKMEIVRTFDIPVGKCAGPQGMAIGPAPQILLGCNAKGPPTTGTGASETGTGPQNAAVLDENSGQLIKVLANQGGNDEVWFNPGDGLYFLAEGQNAAFEQLGIVNSTPIFVSQDVIVAPGGEPGRAHSVAADPNKNEAYLPIPNNAGSDLCPTANGCIAVFGTDQSGKYVYRGQ